ncbi:MAG: riboflavin synthase [Planctomycetes bacterium]|nr:riboflavin synthase [Planctomycetota bacterium]
MFTGLIEAQVPVREVERRGTGLALWLGSPGAGWSFQGGESVAVSGACLTVVGLRDPRSGARLPWGTEGAELLFELSSETLARTWFGAVEPGRRVNLERALRLGDRLDGHLVSGHVDGVGRVVLVRDTGDGGRCVGFEAPAELERFLVDKGSVTVDGISLTVVAPHERRFDVAVIPATLEKTTLGGARVGDPVHLEADQLGKWIDRLLAARAG